MNNTLLYLTLIILWIPKYCFIVYGLIQIFVMTQEHTLVEMAFPLKMWYNLLYLSQVLYESLYIIHWVHVWKVVQNWIFSHAIIILQNSSFIENHKEKLCLNVSFLDTRISWDTTHTSTYRNILVYYNVLNNENQT